MLSSYITNATLLAAGAIMVMLFVFTSWKAFKGTSNLLHWRSSAALFYVGMLCFIAKLFTRSYVDAAGFLHEKYFFLIPIGYLFLFFGSAIAIMRLLLNEWTRSGRSSAQSKAARSSS